MMKSRTACLIAALMCVAPLVAPTPVHAQGSSEAGKHFQRGVGLFNEADYAGALVEFKKANELAPNPAVLFNIAQTQYQLRSYAAALGTFERFLAESGPTAEHRSEAQSALETLKSRVGKLDIAAPEKAEIAIDDEAVGTAPLAPVVVSVGRRRVVATKDGKTSTPKVVEVSAGETQRVELVISAAPPAPVTKAAPVDTTPAQHDEAKPSRSYALPIALFAGAGATAVGAAITGVLAAGANGDLKDERGKFPADRGKIDDLSGKTKTLALVTDVLGASTIVLAGVGLYFTLTNKPKASTALAPSVNLRLTATGAGLEGRF